MEGKKSVAIYVRISTDKQKLDRQLEICKAFCERQDYEIYKIYEDIYSGAKDTRPDFNKMLDDMRNYSFDTIVVTKLDRIGRSLQHLLTMFDEFKKKDVKFIAVTQNIDTSTPMGNLQMQILGAFAEFEKNLISERTKEGLKGKENVGKRGKDKKPRLSRSDRGKIRPHVRKKKLMQQNEGGVIKSQ